MKHLGIYKRWAFAGAFLCVVSCSEFQEPVPTAPGPVPPPPPSDFRINGHWEATTSQGRRLAFDVTRAGQVVNGRINAHHDCATGRWRITFDGFTAPVVDNAFLTTVNWRNTGLDGVVRSGTYTVSGRFEADNVVVGGFVNAVTDIRFQEKPNGDVCPSIEASFEGNKE